MFLLLSKILPVFVYPFGLSLVLLAVAASLRRRAGWTRALCFAAFVLLFVFGSGSVAQLLVRSLENRYRRVPIESVPQAQAIVVLGGGTSVPPINPGGLPQLGGSSDRLLYAARLFRAGKAPLILFSGGGVPFEQSAQARSEAESGLLLLQEWGVPANAILLEDKSRNTRENAVLSRAILRDRGISRILLVTSAWHMPRASAVFGKVGFQAIPAPADFQTADSLGVLPLLIPGPDALAESETVLKEWLGLFVYRLRGWD
jgi:uncharacterized SAM-binding protein YcdF (DUF218 family)